MRYSRQREIIEKIVKDSTSHPTADEVYEAARAIDAKISLGTVYRNLKQMAEGKEAITLETEDDRLHYDGNVSPHGHFMCNRCGKIIDLFYTDRNIGYLNGLGLTIESAKCVYYGLCEDCKKDKIKG